MGKMDDLRTALAATLSTLELQANPYVLSNATPPYAEVEPGAIRYDLAMQRGWDEWNFAVRIYVTLTGDIGAQVALDQYIDPTGASSVKTLIEVDRTLGGICDFVLVTGNSGYQPVQSKHAGTLMLGCEWAVCVHVSN